MSQRRCFSQLRISWRRIYRRRFNCNYFDLVGRAQVGTNSDRFADLMAKKRLADRSLVGNNMPFRITIPRAKDGVSFFAT